MNKLRLKKEKPNIINFVDKKLIVILVFLMCASLLLLYSSAPYIASNFSVKSLLIKQLMWFCIGSVVLMFFMYNGNEFVVPFFKLLYIILMVLLIFLCIDSIIFQKIWPIRGLTFGSYDPILFVNGATSWYNIPGIGSFQPSEFMKICLIVLNANIIAEHNENKDTSTYQDDFRLLLKMAKISLPPMLLIFLQPDTGLVFIIIISLFFMVCSASINKGWLITIFSVIVITISVFFILFFFQPSILHQFISQVRLSRIYGWIYPDQYPAYSYQATQSIIAMGSAGLNGYGINNAIPAALHISEAHTDFIFAMTGTIFGGIGMLIVFGLQFALTTHLMTTAIKAKQLFEKYFMIGTIGIIFYQQIQNMGMVLNILPITGITLPLVSYGGSSLISYFLLFGITMNIYANTKNSIQNY